MSSSQQEDKSRQPEALAETLQRRLRIRGLDQTALASWVCQAANEVGGGRFSAIRWQRNTLTISVPHGPAAHQLSLEEENLKTAIRARLGWPPDRPLRIRMQL